MITAKDFWYILCSKTKPLHTWGKVSSLGWPTGRVCGLQRPPPPRRHYSLFLHLWRGGHPFYPEAPWPTAGEKESQNCPFPSVSHHYRAALRSWGEGEKVENPSVGCGGLLKIQSWAPSQTCRISGKAEKSKFLNQSWMGFFWFLEGWELFL